VHSSDSAVKAKLFPAGAFQGVPPYRSLPRASMDLFPFTAS